MIDINRLSRNFKTLPIKPKEEILKSDLLYLFKELNLTKGEVAEILGISDLKVFKFCKLYNITKTQQEITTSQQNKMLRIYGVTNAMKLPNVVLRCKQSNSVTRQTNKELSSNKRRITCLKKYGVDNPSKSNDIKNKKKITCQSNYSVDNPHKCSSIKQKIKQTKLEKYGGNTLQKCSSSRLKYEATMHEKYAVTNPMLNKNIANKSTETLKNRINEIKEYNKLRIGVEWPAQLQSVKDKIIASKTRNGTHNCSSIEDKIFILLNDKYSQVKRQYKCNKYPFACDFFVEPLDLYIECNFTWTHGFCLYDENDKSCIEKLKNWQEKAITSNYYKNAIYTWTDLDVRKFNIAKENNLNYLVFYNEKQFMKWYNAQ